MYPHARLLLASVTFSASLGIFIALVGFLAALWLGSEPVVDPPDNAPIRAVGVLIYAVAPAIGVLSLVLSIPGSYLQWHKPRSFTLLASLCAVVAIVVVVALFLPGSSFRATATSAAIFATLMVAATKCWEAVMPRSNNSLERTRDR